METQETLPVPTSSQTPLIPMTPRGIQLNTLEDMYRFADCVLQSGLKGFQNKQAMVVAMELGAELGLGVMSSLQNIAVINGRPSVYGDIQLGLCQSSGIFDNSEFHEWTEGVFPKDDFTAHCKAKRVNSPHAIVRTFSIADAKRAKLWSKAGPWSDYPQRMLMWRARGWALRDTFPDVLKGLYSRDEARDIPIVAEVVPESVPLLPDKPRAEQLADNLPGKKKRAAKSKAKPESVPEPVTESAVESAVELPGTVFETLHNTDCDKTVGPPPLNPVQASELNVLKACYGKLTMDAKGTFLDKFQVSMFPPGPGHVTREQFEAMFEDLNGPDEGGE